MDTHLSGKTSVINVLSEALENISFSIEVCISQRKIAGISVYETQLHINIAIVVHGQVAGRPPAIRNNQCTESVRQEQTAVVAIRWRKFQWFLCLTTCKEYQQEKR